MKKMSVFIWSTLVISLMAVSHKAAALFVTADVVSGYSDCKIVPAGPGLYKVSATIAYKAAAGRLNKGTFVSRGLAFYHYSAEGVAFYRIYASAYLDGSQAKLPPEHEFGVTVYTGGVDKTTAWYQPAAMTVVAESVIAEEDFNAWGGLTVRAANSASTGIVADLQGGVFITLANSGTCVMLADPHMPPKVLMRMSINAPDWNLGEIKPGEQSIPLTTSADQLCLEYDRKTVDSKQFIITASNQNGVVNNQYRMMKAGDTTQAIPYRLTLNSGLHRLVLPNLTGSAIPLEAGGKTCFMPTFTTMAPKGIQSGEYSDVLTFNIVTQS